jgi:hypothetical protein
MFKFIKKLFKKEKKPEVVITNNPEIEALDAELNERLKALDERRERSIAIAEKAVACRNELASSLKRLGVVYKFRDTETGEIHEVQPDDHETFSEMMGNRKMQIVFD